MLATDPVSEIKYKASEALAAMGVFNDRVVPYNFAPRGYQKPFVEAMEDKDRAALVWHRRAGKDKTMLNFTFKKMFDRVGIYFYLLPTYAQGKKIVWNGIDRDGFKHMDHLPQYLRRRTNNAEMLVEAVNGSIFQVVGTDNYDSIMGTNPVGVVFSEYSLQNPIVWDFIRPILAENGGWAIFNYTARGKNHGYDLIEMAKANPKWFAQVLTVRDTKRPDGTPVISDEIIQEERDAGMDESLIKQEFYCDFNAANQGAYYGKQFERAEEENRITTIHYEPELKVNTFWDIGVSDSTCIVFTQSVNKEHRIIDYYESNNEGLEHYINMLKGKPYDYDKHWAPHDIKVREFTSGMSRWEIAKDLGIHFDIVPDVLVKDGIDAVRRVLQKCWFDNTKNRKEGNSMSGCWWLVNALKSYHKEYDDKKHCYKDQPLHDWSSHPADSFRYFAVATKPKLSIMDVFNR